jgi:hypothetical protein
MVDIQNTLTNHMKKKKKNEWRRKSQQDNQYKL